MKSYLSKKILMSLSAFAVMSACTMGRNNPKLSNLNNYDQLQRNPVDKGIIPSKLFLNNGEYDDGRCEVNSPSNVVQMGAETITFKRDGDGARSANWTALNSILDPIASSSALKVTVINIVRVNGVPYYHYLSNGTQNDAVQTWSSSKPMAFAAAASQLRFESNGAVGIDGFTKNTNGDGGDVPIGDLVSIATVYRERVKPYNSNNLGTWAQNVSGRPHSTKLINTWLQRPGESFGGGYGDNGSGLTGEFKSADGKVYKTQLSASGAGSNSISTLTFADFYRRIILHRELAEQDVAAGRDVCDPKNMPSLSLPCVKWSDMKTILYGASPKTTRYIKDRAVGGMMGGMSVLLHNAASNGDPSQLNLRHGGRWKIFTKVGWGEVNGIPDTRWHGYGCFPSYDASGKPTASGKEYMISVALKPMPGLTTDQADKILQKAVRGVTARLMDGSLK